MRFKHIAIGSLAVALAGCGGGGTGTTLSTGGTSGGDGSNPIQTNGKSATTIAATFKVDVNTGKVTIVAKGGEKRPGMFTGNSVGFLSTVLSNDSVGGSGARSVNVQLVNNTDMGLGVDQNGVVTGLNVLFGGIVNTTGIQDQRANTTVSTLAGSNLGNTTFADGSTAVARFNQPYGVAVATDGAVYVADYGNNRIRKIKSGLVSTFAGKGAAAEQDGPASAAEFEGPYDLAANPVDGSLVVVDFNGNKIRRVSSTGVVSTVAGTGTAGGTNGAGNVASFTNPTGVTVDGSGNIYVSEATSNRIRKITLSGNPSSSANYTVSAFAGNGTSGLADGSGASAELFRPYGLATDPTGNVYVADDDNNAIRMIDPSGNVTTIAGTGTQSDLDGFGNNATFNHPLGITFLSGAIFVSEIGSEEIREVAQIPGGAGTSSSWIVETIAGAGTKGAGNGSGSTATFGAPYFIAASASSNLYVSDLSNNMIREVNPATGVFPIGIPTGTTNTNQAITLSNPTGYAAVTDFGAQTPYVFYSGTLAAGQSSAAQPWNFLIPSGVTSFQFQVIVEASTQQLLALASAFDLGSPNVDVRVLAGNVENGYFNGGPSEAEFDGFCSLALDGSGIVYVSDTNNNAIRRIDLSGNVTTVAGTVASGIGYADGSGAVAKLSGPEGIAVNRAGTEIFVADNENEVIRRIALTGFDPTDPASWTVTTIAGQQNVNGTADGPGGNASFSHPYGLAISPGGDLYTDDNGASNDIRRIEYMGGDRSLASSWYVTLVAGKQAAGFVDGNGTGAQFYSPSGIACDGAGNLYIADVGNNAIRKMDPAQNVTTYAGTGASGYLDGPGNSAKFNFPKDVAVDSGGSLYVCDNANDVIRLITPSAHAAYGQVSTIAGNGLNSYANGPGNTAEFGEPAGCAVSSSGVLYVSDGFFPIRMIQNVFTSASGPRKR